jgi:hypothetical protein
MPQMHRQGARVALCLGGGMTALGQSGAGIHTGTFLYIASLWDASMVFSVLHFLSPSLACSFGLGWWQACGV